MSCVIEKVVRIFIIAIVLDTNFSADEKLE